MRKFTYFAEKRCHSPFDLVRIFGKQLLLNNQNEMRTVVSPEREVPTLSFSALLRKQLPTPLFFNVLDTTIA